MATIGMQMHVRQWRGLLWVATLGLVGLAGWQGFGMWQRHGGGAYIAKDSAHFTGLIGEALGTIDQKSVSIAEWRDYQKLVSVPINGYVPPPPAKPVVVDDTPAPISEKPLADVLKVNAITEAPSGAGRVVVKYKDETVKPLRDELILAVGGTLTYPYDGEPYHGKLKSIRGDSAIFEWFGKDVELHPTRREEGIKSPTVPGAGTAAVETGLTTAEQELLAAHKNAEKTVALPDDAGFVIGNEDYSTLSNKADEYLREARLSDAKDADGKKYYTVGMLRNTSYLAKTYGIQTGDQLISINGTPVNGKAQAYTYVRENSNLAKYVVVIRRKGKDVTKTILVNRDKS
ncbi:MAG: hypothetical protein FJ293_08995 [Planctomycetes bacterium]|nr:hypothetical protein [Planctomycetota bacterium]